MKGLHRLGTRMRNLVSNRRGDERLREEIEHHLAIQTGDNLRAGMTHDEARRQAVLKFGPVDTIREEYHSEESLSLIENLLLDLRYGVRMLRKTPSFTVVAMLTLALGIGANIVVFGILNAVLLRPLDVQHPETLYQIRHKTWMSGRLVTTSYPAFDDLRRRNHTFVGLIGINAYSSVTMRFGNFVRAISGDEVSGNYFDLLGVEPALGRFFHAADEHGPGSAPYIVLSDALWQSAFQSDRSVIGKIVELNKHPFTVIGVTSARFHGTERFAWPEYWIPMLNEEQVAGSDYLHNRAGINVTVIGRLKPGVTPQQATDDLNGIVAQLAREYPTTDDGLPLRLIHPGLYGDDADVIRGFLYGVNALALLVLAAACANLASLFAARASDRTRELALRAALGASRSRLATQLLTEALLISVMGGAAGVATAALLLKALNRWPPAADAHLAAGVTAPVYLAGVILTFGSAFLFGIVPARHAWQSSPLEIIKGAVADSAYVRRFAVRDLLLGLQIAICTVLVTASLVAVQGMMYALHAPLGVQPKGAMLVDLDLSQVAPSADLMLQKQREMIDAALSVPGVTAAGAVTRMPMTGGLHGIPVYEPGTTEFRMDNYALLPYVFSMSPGYLNAAGTRLLRGDDVSWQDTSRTPYIAIVNNTFARKLWGEREPLGQHFVLWGKLTEVVGVTEDGKYHDLAESPPPVVYLPFSQNQSDEAIFVVRSRRPASEMAGALKRTFGRIEPNLPITIQSWTDLLEDELLPARAATVALGVMGFLAAMLSVTGIFGMAAYTVSRRMKELGIRVALGAHSVQVVRAAVGRPIVLLGVGSLLGLIASVLATRLLEQIVYRANPRDPVVMTGVVLTMALLGLLASAIPARRAMGVNPSTLMRDE